jgi:hypothetical protein
MLHSGKRYLMPVCGSEKKNDLSGTNYCGNELVTFDVTRKPWRCINLEDARPTMPKSSSIAQSITGPGSATESFGT